MADLNLFKRIPSLLTLVVLELVLLVLISYQLRGAKRENPLEQLTVALFGPLQQATHRIMGRIDSAVEHERSQEELLAENKLLKAQLDDAAMLRVQLEEAELELERLRDLAQMPPPEGWEMIPAEVVGRTQRRNDYMITINKGSNSGITPDMGVACKLGVVGIVWEVSGSYAKVMTANNPSSVVAALAQDSRYQESFVAGYDLLTGKLENFPNFENIRNGDLILTSGLDEVWPKGLPIGHVIKAQPSSYLFQDVVIHFSTDFSRLEEVVILKPKCEEPPL